MADQRRSSGIFENSNAHIVAVDETGKGQGLLLIRFGAPHLEISAGRPGRRYNGNAIRAARERMTMRAARRNTGSLIFDKQRGTWRFLQWVDGKRRSQTIGTLAEFPDERSGWREVERLSLSPERKRGEDTTVKALAARWETERFPARADTRRVYKSFLRCHVIPQWGDKFLGDVRPRDVELWLKNLKLAPKSRTHIRSILHQLFEFGMWVEVLEIERNPISLVRNPGATRKVRQVRNLTVEEFQQLVQELPEPFSTLVLCCGCLGLRISECLALRFSDLDWLRSSVTIQRSIVAQVVDAPKTQGSEKSIIVAPELLDRLRSWKQCSQFAADEDRIFSSPQKLGKLPYSYTGIVRIIRKAATKAGISGRIATHTFRHSFRSWMGAAGIPVAIQRELMRHSTVGMTLSYGTTFDAELESASGKISDLVFNKNGSQTDHNPS
jgi:integrase